MAITTTRKSMCCNVYAASTLMERTALIFTCGNVPNARVARLASDTPEGHMILYGLLPCLEVVPVSLTE